MNIVGFGDSFISENGEYSPEYGKCYLDTVGTTLSAKSVTWAGCSGSSIWDAFFQFKNYEKLTDIDVAVFAWTDVSRLYHYRVRNLCPYGSSLRANLNGSDADVWLATKHYYTELYAHEKTEYEAQAFFHWFDNLTLSFPKIKFIHMWGFSKNTQTAGSNWDRYAEDNVELEYHHRFKNGVEIRPALMNFSRRDGWPSDDDLANETRANHLTLKNHDILSSIIVNAIENYEPGKIFTEKKI